MRPIGLVLCTFLLLYCTVLIESRNVDCCNNTDCDDCNDCSDNNNNCCNENVECKSKCRSCSSSCNSCSQNNCNNSKSCCKSNCRKNCSNHNCQSNCQNNCDRNDCSQSNCNSKEDTKQHETIVKEVTKTIPGDLQISEGPKINVNNSNTNLVNLTTHVILNNNIQNNNNISVPVYINTNNVQTQESEEIEAEKPVPIPNPPQPIIIQPIQTNPPPPIQIQPKVPQPIEIYPQQPCSQQSYIQPYYPQQQQQQPPCSQQASIQPFYPQQQQQQQNVSPPEIQPQRCCLVYHPKKCYYDEYNRPRCIRYRHSECGPICSSKVVYLENSQNPVAPSCHRIQNYPYAYCGNYQKLDCGSCYSCGGQFNPSQCSQSQSCNLGCRKYVQSSNCAQNYNSPIGFSCQY